MFSKSVEVKRDLLLSWYPIVDENLLWDKKWIYVAGALAELELGPSARNIAGARLAAERIVQAFI